MKPVWIPKAIQKSLVTGDIIAILTPGEPWLQNEMPPRELTTKKNNRRQPIPAENARRG